MNHQEAFAACVARIKRHKEKCDYKEPEMESILAAGMEFGRIESKLDRDKLALVISKIWEQDDLVIADAVIAYIREGQWK